jgi:hypothetical protein
VTNRVGSKSIAKDTQNREVCETDWCPPPPPYTLRIIPKIAKYTITTIHTKRDTQHDSMMQSYKDTFIAGYRIIITAHLQPNMKLV